MSDPATAWLFGWWLDHHPHVSPDRRAAGFQRWLDDQGIKSDRATGVRRGRLIRYTGAMDQAGVGEAIRA